MKKMRPIQYTVRDVSEATDLRMREAAALENISLNQAALRALERGLGLAEEPVRYRSLGALVAKADKVDRKSWDATLASLDQIHPEDWK